MNHQMPGASRGELVRALPRPLLAGLGAVMAALFAYALWQSVPDREAVALEKRGTEALRAASYAEAENDFAAVLRREPASADARLGLACSYYLTGKRSAATLELTLGLGAGMMSLPTYRELELIRLYAGHEAGRGSGFAKRITSPASMLTGAISCIEAVLPFSNGPIYVTMYIVPLTISLFLAAAIVAVLPY